MALTLQPIRGFPPYSDFFLRGVGGGGLYTGDRDEQSKTRESPLTLYAPVLAWVSGLPLFPPETPDTQATPVSTYSDLGFFL